MKLRLFICLLLVILIAALTCIPALADVIWEPKDQFYEQKRVDCVYTNRSYTTNGKGGTVDVLKEPGSNEIVATINNGNELYVSFTYPDTDGERWGVVEFNPDSEGNLSELDLGSSISGWIQMTELKPVYDYISFAEDHQSEFKPYTGDYKELKSISPIVFWSYPGSGVVIWKNDAFEINEYFKITQTYTDSDNRLWGFVEYFYGARNCWICVSDPSGNDLELSVTPQADETPIPSGDQTTPLPSAEPPVIQKDQTTIVILIAVIVAAVVIVTGIIIAVLWKKSVEKDSAVK